MTIKHVHRFKDRHGKVRHYLRLPGVKAIALPGAPGEPAFMLAYNQALEQHAAPAADNKSKAAPGSMRDLAERYYATGRFTIMTPDALRLRHEPAADCARYDSLRRAL